MLIGLGTGAIVGIVIAVIVVLTMKKIGHKEEWQ